MTLYDQTHQAPPVVYPAPPPPVLQPPPGYPSKDGQVQPPPPAGPTRDKGDGFWRGCCAGLCCCCLLDMCF